MRLLLSAVGGEGHLRPLLPLALAATAAGHEVGITAAPSLRSAAAGGGRRFFPARPDVRPVHAPLRPVDREREQTAVRDAFAGWMARERAEDLLRTCSSWRPDVIVRDELDFATPVIAELLGVPDATVLVNAAGGFVRPELVTGPLQELRSQHGLPADPDLAMLTRHLALTPLPAAFRDPAAPLPATAHGYRSVEVVPGRTELPFRRSRPGAPLVHLTLGTIFNTESGDLLGRLLAGLAGLPIEIVATVGRGVDRRALLPQPQHVHLLSYVPASILLPHCAAVVNHGGSGSVVGALAHGLPMVCVPLGADQPGNADRVAALGLGRTLDALTADPPGTADAVTEVLEDGSYRSAAGAWGLDIARLPGPGQALARLEGLVGL